MAQAAMFGSSTQRSIKSKAFVLPPFIRRANTSLSPAKSESSDTISGSEKNKDPPKQTRNPRSLQALHLAPLKHEAEYGIPSCDLQLRSFSLTPLQFFSDFALRAAYYLGLPASGPIPLPRITERWTVPRSHFIFKKSQENFERVTLRRMIQIKDGNPETVQLWLAYLRKHQYFGVGMKANIWEFGPVGISESMKESSSSDLETSWSHLGQTKTIDVRDKIEELLSSRRFKEAAGLRQPPTVTDVTK